MDLAPTLTTLSEVLHKLEREQHRTFIFMHPIHKADHLYNFCVTSNALRDWFFNDRALTDKYEKQPYWEKWAKNPHLKAAYEIANNSKHFSLTQTAKTKKVEIGSREMMFTSVSKSGVPQRKVVKDYSDIIITLSSGEQSGLLEFTDSVITSWKDFFENECYTIEEQSYELLTGQVA